MKKLRERDLSDEQRKDLQDARLEQTQDPKFNSGYHPYISSETGDLRWRRNFEASKVFIGIILVLVIAGIVMLAILVTRPASSNNDINEDNLAKLISDRLLEEDLVDEESLANLVAEKLLDSGIFVTKEDFQSLFDKLGSIELPADPTNQATTSVYKVRIKNIFKYLTDDQIVELSDWIKKTPSGSQPKIRLKQKVWTISTNSSYERSITFSDGFVDVDFTYVAGAYAKLYYQDIKVDGASCTEQFLVIEIWPAKQSVGAVDDDKSYRETIIIPDDKPDKPDKPHKPHKPNDPDEPDEPNDPDEPDEPNDPDDDDWVITPEGDNAKDKGTDVESEKSDAPDQITHERDEGQISQEAMDLFF